MKNKNICPFCEHYNNKYSTVYIYFRHLTLDVYMLNMEKYLTCLHSHNAVISLNKQLQPTKSLIQDTA